MTNRNRKMEILEYINHYVSSKGYPPTVREMCDAVGLASTSTVHTHLISLEKKGYLIKDKTKPRAIEITPLGLEALGIKKDGDPMKKLIRSGLPFLNLEKFKEHYRKSNNSPFLVFQITDESMFEAGIISGDYVIVRQQNQFKNGDIVVSLIDNQELTCKRYFNEDGHIRLQAENTEISTIIYDNIEIIGKVVSLYREYPQ